MSKQKKFLVGAAALVLLSGLTVTKVIQAQTNDGQAPLQNLPNTSDLDKPPLTKNTETSPLNVATLEEESNQLPESLKLASNRSVKADEVATASIDALIVTRQALLGLKENPALKNKLRNFVAQGKILMIQNAANIEMEKELGIELPVKTETELPVLFSSVVQLVDGQYFGSAVLAPPSEIEGALAPRNIAQIARNEIHALRNQVREENRARRLKASSWGTSQNWRTTWDLCPYGYYVETSRTKQVLGDGSTTYDYWSTELEEQTTGGIQACSSSYQVDSLYISADVGVYNYNSALVSYGPTTTNSSSTQTVNIGFPSFSLNFSWSYSTPDVAVIDHTSYANDKAAWTHDYQVGTNSAKYVYYSKPGLSARASQGDDYSIHRYTDFRASTGGFFPQSKILEGTWKLTHTNYN